MEHKEIYDQVVALVCDQLHKKPEDILPSSTLDSLGADSLDRVELVMKIEEIFEIEVTDDAAEQLRTIEDAVLYIAQHKK